jgi:hypothetical protein
MKFECNDCVVSGLTDMPCILKIKGLKRGERDNWRRALRRCPFENDINGKFTGDVPLAHWY